MTEHDSKNDVAIGVLQEIVPRIEDKVDEVLQHFKTTNGKQGIFTRINGLERDNKWLTWGFRAIYIFIIVSMIRNGI